MASLILADGTVFRGESFGAKTDSDGEVVFNTGMAGYPESLTDPSYRGQILTFTYPLVGNYGVPEEKLNSWGFSDKFESEEIHVRGVIVAQASETHSHHLAKEGFGEWLERHGIPGITGIDTRALTLKLRETGVMLGRIVQDDRQTAPGTIEDPNLRNLVAEVCCTEPVTYEPLPEDRREKTPTVIAYDCGMKRNILRSLLKRGLRVVRVPWDFRLSSYTDPYDGVFFSNGPGDPKLCVPTIKALAQGIALDKLTFGICLGNQLMALAIGGDTYKLKYGHRGCNQPCTEVRADDRDRCIITSQNHGFAVSEQLPAGWNVWWKNANDGTVEGLRHDSGRFFSVQFHPEAAPGPEDANELFDQFAEMLYQEVAGR